MFVRDFFRVPGAKGALLAFALLPIAAVSSFAEVSSGQSRDLDAYRPAYDSVAPQGYSLCDAVGIGIAGSNDHVFVWFRDGMVSSGNTRELGAFRPPEPYRLAPGQWPEDVVAMAIAGSNDWVYAWYRNGTVSAGSSTDLTLHRQPEPYSLPPGKDPLSIVGIGIAGSSDRVFAWFDDGTVSSGSSRDLDEATPPQSVATAVGFRPTDIVDLGIAGSDDHVYAWYARCNRPKSQTLNVRLFPQETGEWCWAATGQTTMRHIGNVDVPQCVQANNRLSHLTGGADCCGSPVPAGCVHGGGPEYSKYGFSHNESSVISWYDLTGQLANGGPFRGRPFGFSWTWLVPDAAGKLVPSNSGHIMVSIGYASSSAGDYVEIMDPSPPGVGDHRFDLYTFWRKDPADHVHDNDYLNIRYTGGP
ncbi:MAG: hypothetical protein WAT70_14785 [Rhizobiaceae bacterium]